MTDFFDNLDHFRSLLTRDKNSKKNAFSVLEWKKIKLNYVIATKKLIVLRFHISILLKDATHGAVIMDTPNGLP